MPEERGWSISGERDGSSGLLDGVKDGADGAEPDGLPGGLGNGRRRDEILIGHGASRHRRLLVRIGQEWDWWRGLVVSDG